MSDVDQLTQQVLQLVHDLPMGDQDGPIMPAVSVSTNSLSGNNAPGPSDLPMSVPELAITDDGTLIMMQNVVRDPTHPETTVPVPGTDQQIFIEVMPDLTPGYQHDHDDQHEQAEMYPLMEPAAADGEAVTEPADIPMEDDIVEDKTVGDGDEIPEVDVDGNNNRPGHHVGKIPISYVKEKVKRRHTFFKRKCGVIKKCKELAALTDAKISLRIVNADTQKAYSFYSHKELMPGKRKAHLRVQTEGGTFIPAVKAELGIGGKKTSRSTASEFLGTPTKQQRHLPAMEVPTSSKTPSHGIGPRCPASKPVHQETTPCSKSKSTVSRMEDSPIRGLPGKKKRKTKNTVPAAESVNNKCQVCKIIYQSAADKALDKQYKRQNKWLGCEHIDAKGVECNYFGHARCVGVFLKPRVSIKKIPFFCPKHQ